VFIRVKLKNAGDDLTMNLSSILTTSRLRTLTWLLWLGFVGGTALLLIADASRRVPLSLAIALLLLILVVEFALLLRYVRFVAQWRGIALFWAFSILTNVMVWFSQRNALALLYVVSMCFLLYAMFAGWFATVALAIRRDVSVAYFTVFVVLGVIVFHFAINTFGGVLGLFDYLAGASDIESLPLVMVGPLLWGITWMGLLAYLTFPFHFLWLLIKEERRASL